MSQPLTDGRNGELWLCGCETWREGETFMIRPHSLDCIVYETALELGRERGNTIEMRYEANGN